ncbi:MAG: DUF1700 domain-containing protein [Anaerolineae bacterium]
MTKSEFLERLAKELNRNKISAVAEIVGEYEQHFAFKIADGFTEEEVAAKLGDPAQLAAQFGPEAAENEHKGNKAIAGIGLGLLGIFVGVFFILMAAWGISLGAFALGSLALAIGLFAGLSQIALVTPMPYGSAVLFGIAVAALAVLAAVGCIYFMAFLGQLGRSYGRFHHNTMAAAAGNPVLPSVTAYPRFQPKVKRSLRRLTLISLSIFATFCVLAVAFSILNSGSLEFWHTWGWFR